MENRRHEEILKKFQYLKDKDIEYNTELKSIDKRLKDEHDCNDLDEAKSKLKDVKEKIESSNNRLDDLLEKVEEAADWDEIEIKED